MHTQSRLLALCLIQTLAASSFAADAVRVVPPGAVPEARQPQLAVDASSNVYVVYGAGEAIYCSRSKPGALEFAPPVKIGQLPKLALGMRRGPRIATSGKAVVVTAQSHADRSLVAWRSTDLGVTWQGPQNINSEPGSTPEGLHNLAASPDGTLYCVWLDLREKQGQQVYGAASRDGGATWQANRKIYASPDEGICPCCQPSVAFDLAGGLHVMWRNDLSGARDMYLSSSKDRGQTFSPPIKLGQGTWKLNSCPMDGGGLAGDASGNVRTIWRRDKELFSCDAGQPEVSLGKGEQGWAIAQADGIGLVWLAARPGALLAQMPGVSPPARIAEQASDPVVAASPTGQGPVIVAWDEGPKGKTEIRAVQLRQR